MDDISPLLSQIIEKELSYSKAERSQITYAQIIDLLTAISKAEKSALSRSYEASLLRILEVNFLRDKIISNIGNRWVSFSDSSGRQNVQNRLNALTKRDVPSTVVDHIVNIFSGTALSYGRRSVPHDKYSTTIFERIHDGNINKELRCSCCGYHFLQSDMNEEKANLAIAVGLKFASSIETTRLEDKLKPLTSANYTRLEIDHIIPEETLGGTYLDNLEILCGFCNSGKKAYRWGLEPISIFGVGGFSNFPAGREMNVLLQTIVVSAYNLHNGECVICGKNKDSVEITARERAYESDDTPTAMAPWNLELVCYDCC